MERWILAGLIGLPFTISVATSVGAEENHRQLGAHEHGHGSFNIAIEGKRVSMELEAPGADIVGFEHKATTDDQKASVANAEKILKKLSNVVGLPAAAGCQIQQANVELHIEEAEDHDEHKHSHDKTEAAKTDTVETEEEASHSEFHAEYELTCALPEKLVELTFPYFNNFKGAEELEVSIVGPKSQKKFEVERDTGKINLGGII
ncbi:MAG: DUF2796 domain-containing protein [Hyphomicrobiaceae bacterium]